MERRYSSAISPITSLAAASYRMFSGVVAGGTSALVYNQINEQCCNRALKRLEQMENLLETAEGQLKKANYRPV